MKKYEFEWRDWSILTVLLSFSNYQGSDWKEQNQWFRNFKRESSTKNNVLDWGLEAKKFKAVVMVNYELDCWKIGEKLIAVVWHFRTIKNRNQRITWLSKSKFCRIENFLNEAMMNVNQFVVTEKNEFEFVKIKNMLGLFGLLGFRRKQRDGWFYSLNAPLQVVRFRLRLWWRNLWL